MCQTTGMTNTASNLTNRINIYAGSCVSCGSKVEAGTGHLVSKDGGRWSVAHGNTSPAGRACPGQVTIVAAVPAPAYRYVGMTWAQVMEANEFFDGEDEPRTAARRRWERESGMFCPRHGDRDIHDDTCWECNVERHEAAMDRLDAARG